MDRARLFGTPRPESQAIRLHNPPVMKAFNSAWEAFFRQGVADHAIKELCRLYIAKSVECQYCGGQRSVLARQQGATESQVDDIVDDVDGVHRNLAGFVEDFVNEPTTMPWGNRSLLFRDPDGNLVNFFTPVTPAAIEKFAR